MTMTSYNSSYWLALGLFAWLSSAPHYTHAASPVMLSPIAVIGTDLGTFSTTADVGKMIDQSGVEVPFVSSVTLFDTYFAKPEKAFAQSGDGGVHNWQSSLMFDLEPHGYVDFDLGASYTIAKLGIWNRSVKNLKITVRETLDGPQQAGGSFTLINRLNFPFSYAADVLTLSQPLRGRYVRLVVDTVYPIAQGVSFGYAIIGEVIASVTGAQPPVIPTVGIAADPTGNLTVTFTGALLTATTPDGPFTPVPGNPRDRYEIPKNLLATQQFFRTVGN